MSSMREIARRKRGFSDAAPAIAVLAAACGTAFAHGGYDRRSWAASTVIVVCGIAVTVLARGPTRPGRWAIATLAAAVMLSGWTFLSAIWSDDPAASVREGERTVLYVAAVFALVVGSRRLAARRMVLLTAASALLVVGYGLFATFLPAGRRIPDAYEGFLLAKPIGYANAIGVVAAIGVLLALGVAASDEPTWLRSAAAASLCVFAPALYLTESRAAWLGLALGLAVALVLSPDRLRLAALGLGIALGPLLAIWLARQFDLVGNTDGSHGRVFVAVVLALAVSTAALVPALQHAFRRRAVVRAAAALFAVVAVGAVAAAAVHGSGPAGDRASYWRVALNEYGAHPLLGSGAGTFARYWGRDRPSGAGSAQDAHSLYIESLAEIGPVGLALVAALFLVPLAAGFRSRRHPHAAVATGALVVYLVHAGLDWDWELPAVTLFALACAGALLTLDSGAVDIWGEKHLPV